MMTEPNAVFWGLFRSLLFSYSLLNFTSSQLLYSLVNFESKFIVIIVLNCVAIKKIVVFGIIRYYGKNMSKYNNKNARESDVGIPHGTARHRKIIFRLS